MRNISQTGMFRIPETLKKYRALFVASAVVFFLQGDLKAQNGESVFKQNCAACHSVGGGKLVGPDLKGVTNKRTEDWLMKFIRSSQSFINSGDADAKAIFDEYKIQMPDQNLADADLKAVIAFIASKSPAETAPAETATTATPEPEAPAARPSSDATAEELALGKMLFTGEVAFTNGGASCISCHNVNAEGVMTGGLLAKDLTGAHSRLGGDAGVNGILNAPPFPAMTQAYKDKGLNEKEIYALTAFLNKADKEKVYQHGSTPENLLIGGLTGLAGLMFMIFIFWFNRKKNSVKKDIYDRQIKSV